jgi:hypothetical protein
MNLVVIPEAGVDTSSTLALYSELLRTRREIEVALSKVPESCQPILDRIKKLEHELSELQVAKSNKVVPVPVDGEAPNTTSQTLSTERPEQARAQRAQVKIKARPLLRKYHPDFGGDPEKFHLVQKAIEENDIEFIHLCLHQENFFCEESVETLNSRLASRLSLLRGSQVFGLARRYHSNSPDFERCFRDLLIMRLNSLTSQLFNPYAMYSN